MIGEEGSATGKSTRNCAAAMVVPVRARGLRGNDIGEKDQTSRAYRGALDRRDRLLPEDVVTDDGMAQVRASRVRRGSGLSRRCAIGGGGTSGP
jgi:hypothetical protein